MGQSQDFQVYFGAFLLYFRMNIQIRWAFVSLERETQVQQNAITNAIGWTENVGVTKNAVCDSPIKILTNSCLRSE